MEVIETTIDRMDAVLKTILLALGVYRHTEHFVEILNVKHSAWIRQSTCQPPIITPTAHPQAAYTNHRRFGNPQRGPTQFTLSFSLSLSLRFRCRCLLFFVFGNERGIVMSQCEIGENTKSCPLLLLDFTTSNNISMKPAKQSKQPSQREHAPSLSDDFTPLQERLYVRDTSPYKENAPQDLKDLRAKVQAKRQELASSTVFSRSASFQPNTSYSY